MNAPATPTDVTQMELVPIMKDHTPVSVMMDTTETVLIVKVRYITV